MQTGGAGSIHRMYLSWSWTGELGTERHGPCPGQESHSQVLAAEAVLVRAAGEQWHLLGPASHMTWDMAPGSAA